jgi:hypothetical protein
MENEEFNTGTDTETVTVSKTLPLIKNILHNTAQTQPAE